MSAINYPNRGMGLESLVEYANQQYAAKGLALIQKIPTPWKVQRRGKKIISAFPERKSTLDFIGSAGGKPIAFDAKQTENKTRFPLANIEQHQFEFMRDWSNQGGKAFVLIEFTLHKQIFYLSFDELVEYRRKTERESIPYEHFAKSVGLRVRQNRGIILDYLEHIG